MELPGECKLCDFLELLRFMYVGSCSISSANCTALLQLSNFYQVRARALPSPGAPQVLSQSGGRAGRP